MISNDIKLIAFDLDDTLWPCMPTIIAAEAAMYEWLNENYPMITQRYSMTSMMGKRKDFMQRNPDLLTDLSHMRYVFLSQIAEQCHYSVEEVAQGGVDIFMSKRNDVTLYDDVIESLDKLSQSYVLASISNGNADVYKTEVGQFMTHAVNASDLKAAKPDPRLFQHIEQKASLEPYQCLYIGDDVHYDVIGSQQAGWDQIWLNRDNKVWPDSLGVAPKTRPSLLGL